MAARRGRAGSCRRRELTITIALLRIMNVIMAERYPRGPYCAFLLSAGLLPDKSACSLCAALGFGPYSRIAKSAPKICRSACAKKLKKDPTHPLDDVAQPFRNETRSSTHQPSHVCIEW